MKKNKAIVIPSFAEYPNIIETLESLQKVQKYNETEIIVVINNSDKSSFEILKNNVQTANYIKKKNPEITVIDCYSKGRAFKDKFSGVGLARKTGFDKAITMLSDNSIIISLDADTVVEKNYIIEIENTFKNIENISAVTIETFHRFPEDIDELVAIIKYELYLRYYYKGLKIVNTPYTIWAIGSSMAFRKYAYIKVGGFNKRKAGEDFYFLQKIRNFGSIKHLTNTKTYPLSRSSNRVPFGTGQTIYDIVNNKKTLDSFPAPELFYNLHYWNNNLKFWVENNFKHNLILPNGSLEIFLRKQNIMNVFHEIKNNSASHDSFMKRYHHWFNGLKIKQYLNFDGRKEKIDTAIKTFWNINFNSLKDALLQIRKMK